MLPTPGSKAHPNPEETSSVAQPERRLQKVTIWTIEVLLCFDICNHPQQIEIPSDTRHLAST
jgi:hypothetical protein